MFAGLHTIKYIYDINWTMVVVMESTNGYCKDGNQWESNLLILIYFFINLRATTEVQGWLDLTRGSVDRDWQQRRQRSINNNNL